MNILELQAAFFALKFASFCKETIKGPVQLSKYNTTAVAADINNIGGGGFRIPQIKFPCPRNMGLVQWQLWVSATHTARKLNVSVDSTFRKFQDKHEWMLNKEAFKVILSLHPELNTDLFATRLNNQLEMYCTRKPGPGCTLKFVNALTIDWSKLITSVPFPLSA